MITPNPKNFLLIGLPSTGKTSFLAALWFAIQQNSVETALVLNKLDGSYTYLNTIRSAWLNYKPVSRNPTDSETLVSMWLNKRAGAEKIHLTFPDVSGESFRQQWATRQLTKSYSECLKKADGGILFIHPKSVVQPLRITEVDDLASLIDEGIADEATGPATSAPPLTPWDIELAPTQVKLVELMQFLMHQPDFKFPFRLVIAISAWDLISPLKIQPETWVKEQLPFLYQFLGTNLNQLQVSFYGISAQGGQYDGSEVSKLKAKNPSTRIEITGENVKNVHDITEPLLWLMR